MVRNNRKIRTSLRIGSANCAVGYDRKITFFKYSRYIKQIILAVPAEQFTMIGKRCQRCRKENAAFPFCQTTSQILLRVGAEQLQVILLYNVKHAVRGCTHIVQTQKVGNDKIKIKFFIKKIYLKLV